MAVRNKTEFIANEIYFITFTIKDWQHIFTSDKYRQLVYKWFDYTKSKYGNQINGYVIMPNHIHILMHITDKAPKISVLIQNAKRFMAYAISNYLQADKQITILKKFDIEPNKKNAKHKIWQPRYDSLLIQTQDMFLQKLNYIHNNPCLPIWALADKPEEYKYSSADYYISGTGYYAVDVIDF
jgi:putative transposase